MEDNQAPLACAGFADRLTILPRQPAHRHDRLHRPRTVLVLRRPQERAQDVRLDLQFLVREQPRAVAGKNRPQQDRAAQDEERIDAVALRAEDVEMTLESADEVFQLDALPLRLVDRKSAVPPAKTKMLFPMG